VGLGAGLDRCGKSRHPPGFDPRTVQPVGSRYTDYATRPTNNNNNNNNTFNWKYWAVVDPKFSEPHGDSDYRVPVYRGTTLLQIVSLDR
jgi:hypothetical protein